MPRTKTTANLLTVNKSFDYTDKFFKTQASFDKLKVQYNETSKIHRNQKS